MKLRPQMLEVNPQMFTTIKGFKAWPIVYLIYF